MVVLINILNFFVGVPTDFALLSILGAFGVAYAILYRASTTNVGRRKRRSIDRYVNLNVIPLRFTLCVHNIVY